MTRRRTTVPRISTWPKLFPAAFALALTCAAATGADELDQSLRQRLADAGVTPLAPLTHDPAKVELGRRLFFDKELSGNRDTACASCHHTSLSSGDARSLPVGTQGVGLGQDRTLGSGRQDIPRNSPELFHRGQAAWTSMFWDSRVSTGDAYFDTPAGDALPPGLDSVLAAQAMFPVTSRDEMRGVTGDVDVRGAANELADLDDDNLGAIWKGLTARLLAIPEYRELLREAYPDAAENEFGFQHAANAIAEFESQAFSAGDSAWDRYLAGDNQALTDAAKRGGHVFYGRGRCATCHTGSLLTDQQHHNIGAPQLGPGKDPATSLDAGRALETGAAADEFAFRTPPLRNVVVTGPWMHNGAYTDLEAVVRHYLDPAAALENYDVAQLDESLRDTVKLDADALHALIDTLDPLLPTNLALSDQDVDDLMAFLFSLTSPSLDLLPTWAPATTPSGLAVDALPPGDVAFLYDVATGELIVQAPADATLTAVMLRLREGAEGTSPEFAFNLDSAAWSTSPEVVLANDVLAQSFLEYRSSDALSFGQGDSLGELLPARLSLDALASHLSAAYMRAGSRALWIAEVRPVPEPTAGLWLLVVLIGLHSRRR